MNRCQTLDFILRNNSECDKIFKLEFFFLQILILLRFYVLESVKEVVDSRVRNRVGTLIAYYSYDSLQINVIFVFL